MTHQRFARRAGRASTSVPADQREIEGAGAKLLQEIEREIAGDFESDRRIGLREAREHVGQVQRREILRRAQSHQPCISGSLARATISSLSSSSRRAEPKASPAAVRVHCARRAFQQLAAERVLETLHLQ